MGRKYVLLDDLDGTELPEDTQPIRLSLGRTTYNLYLTEDNHGKLLKALDPFLENAEKAEPSRGTPAKSSSSSDDKYSKEDKANARRWANREKFEYTTAAGDTRTSLGERGRIPEAIMQGWIAAGSPEVPADA